MATIIEHLIKDWQKDEIYYDLKELEEYAVSSVNKQTPIIYVELNQLTTHHMFQLQYLSVTQRRDPLPICSALEVIGDTTLELKESKRAFVDEFKLIKAQTFHTGVVQIIVSAIDSSNANALQPDVIIVINESKYSDVTKDVTNLVKNCTTWKLLFVHTKLQPKLAGLVSILHPIADLKNKKWMVYSKLTL
jgi:hypothetical protein